jgi:O-glycosyl hydrolase
VTDDIRTQVTAWLTTGDRRHLLESQPTLHFEPAQSVQPMRIILDPTRVDQEIDGFGAALTDSAAWVLTSYLTAGAREQLLQELFSLANGIGLGYLREPVGASDFALYHYTYDDMPKGQSDPALRHFSIAHDEAYILPILRRVREINPHMKIMASPWSPPGWMKHRWLPGNPLYGGRLRRDCYDIYAQYLVAFLRAYTAAGVPIDVLTVQNEPGFGSPRYPSMNMDADEQAEFVTLHLGPALARAGLATKIVIWDHNWNNPGYPEAILNDPCAKRYVSGAAFHCYSSPPRPEALSLVRATHPDRDIYFTECTGMIGSDFARDLRWMIRYLLIGATRHGARAVLLWNLALDEHGNPHTGAGGQCRGVVSVTARGEIERNVEYYALGHASQFVVPGAHRIAATSTSRQIETVAFHNPDGTTVLIVLNDGLSLHTFTVYWGGESFCYALEAGAVATFTWNGKPSPVLLDMSVTLEPTQVPDIMPRLHGWAAVQQWVDNQLQNFAPLVARRLGRRGLLVLVGGGSLLAWLVYRSIHRRPRGQFRTRR